MLNEAKGKRKLLQKLAVITLLVGLIILGVGCRSSANTGSSQQVEPASITCHVFYRNSSAEPLGPESAITLSQHNDRESARFEQLDFSAHYQDDQFEGRSLFITVSAEDTGQQLNGQLYQMDRQLGIRNQFVGGHGFTGLVYVYHPESRAELQYFCNVQSVQP